MRVSVHFTDGEVINATSSAVTFTKMGFPIVPEGSGNNQEIWVSLAALKYVVLQETKQRGKHDQDPREAGSKYRRIVLRFTDGETLRTYGDEQSGHEEEGFSCIVWDEQEKVQRRVLVSLHALKGIFFVKEWDSRTEEEKLAWLPAHRRKDAPEKATPLLGGDADEDPEVRRVADHVRVRLGEVRDPGLTSRDPDVLRKALRTHVDRILFEDGKGLEAAKHEQVVETILRNALGYGALDALLADDEISEIMVNGPKEIYIERAGKIQRISATFEDSTQLMNVIQRIVSQAGRTIDESTPMVDARLPNGSRVNAIIPPAALKGPTLTIRKFGDHQMGIDQLVSLGTISPAMAKFLELATQGRLNILVSGGTGSGKTTTLNVLGGMIQHDQRVVTIEDSAELAINHPHIIPLEYRPPNVEGKGELTIRHLLKNSLRMRPDRIIVGEVRGFEALDLLQAMNTGHDGTMGTIHSNSAGDACSRLETMVLSGSVDLPIEAVRTQIVRGIDLIVHVARMTDGRRKVVQIAEVRGYEGAEPVLGTLYALKTGADGRLEFTPTGEVPKTLDKMAFYGISVPDELFDPAASRYSPAGAGAPLPSGPRAPVKLGQAQDVRFVPVVVQMNQGAAPAPVRGPVAPPPPLVAPPSVAAPVVGAPSANGAPAAEASLPEPVEMPAVTVEAPVFSAPYEAPPLPPEAYSSGNLLVSLAAQAGLDPRVTIALEHVRGGAELRAPQYMRLAGVTPAVANRDLRGAVQAGLLSLGRDGDDRTYRIGKVFEQALAVAEETVGA